MRVMPSNCDQFFSARAQRSVTDRRSAGVLLEDVLRVAADRAGIARVEQLAQHGEVVLLVVDRAIGIRGRRPGQAGIARLRRASRQRLVIRNPAGGAAQHVERVEGRHARAPFRDLQPRIRHVEPLGRGPHGQMQQQPLPSSALRPRWQGGQSAQIL